MGMLSEILRRPAIDSTGRRASIDDLLVDLASGDYPVITHLVTREAAESSRRMHPWEQAWDADGSSLHVATLESGEVIDSHALDDAVLLKRDVLDAQVLDLQHLQATRANDLWLERDDGHLALCSADVSPWAVIRRLGRGWLGVGHKAHLLDWKYVEFLRGDARAAQAGRDYHRRVSRLQPPQIARLVEELPYLHAAELLTLLPDPLAADTLEAMTPERQVQVFEELDEDYAVRVLELMAPDRASDLVSGLTPEIVQPCLARLPADRRQRIITLLQFPDDVAGAIMTNDLVVAPANVTVGEARKLLSNQLQTPDFVYFIYVVDNEATRVLRGVVTLRNLLTSDDDCRLEEIMQPQVVTIDPLESAEDAARRVADLGLVALPVVGRDQRIIGAVTLDAALTQLAPSWRSEIPRVFS